MQRVATQRMATQRVAAQRVAAQCHSLRTMPMPVVPAHRRKVSMILALMIPGI